MYTPDGKRLGKHQRVNFIQPHAAWIADFPALTSVLAMPSIPRISELVCRNNYMG